VIRVGPRVSEHADGKIFSDLPAIKYGREVRDITLTFKNGEAWTIPWGERGVVGVHGRGTAGSDGRSD